MYVATKRTKVEVVDAQAVKVPANEKPEKVVDIDHAALITARAAPLRR